MKKEFFLDILINVAIGIFGLWVLINPGIGIDFVRFYLGIILIVAGVGIGILYFMNKDEKQLLRIVQAISLVVIGILLFFSFRFTVTLIGIILLVWMIVEGIFGLNQMFTYKTFGIKQWPIMLVYSAIAFILAIYILFNIQKGAVTFIQLSGFFAFIKAVFGIIDNVLYRKIYEINKTDVSDDNSNVNNDDVIDV
ncbi:DUF308 domain-containing protein [Mycoplasma sp. P36-A1]|uniref:DUF308 domain-containing protein n=1 Tax=Mycoplasma sp. P36-A1 TaxID=3252900 RepID=UPI003C2B3EA5